MLALFMSVALLGYLKVVIFVLEPVCQIVKEGLPRSSHLPCGNISADLL